MLQIIVNLTLILCYVYCKEVFDPEGRRPNLTKRKEDNEGEDPLDLRSNDFQKDG